MDKISRREVHTGAVVDRPVITSAGALIYCASTGRYLFLLRDGIRYAGTWGLVGGKIEPDEDVLSGLYREIREEIGLNLDGRCVAPIEEFVSQDGYFKFRTFVILVENEFVPVLNSEHCGYAWTGIQHIPKPMHPGLWNMLKLTRLHCS